jgi:hypothetical protein
MNWFDLLILAFIIGIVLLILTGNPLSWILIIIGVIPIIIILGFLLLFLVIIISAKIEDMS